MVLIYAQLIGGVRVQVHVEATSKVADLHESIAQAVGRPATSFKMVHKGAALQHEHEGAVVKLGEGDSILVMPNRKAPPARLVNAALRSAAGAGRSGEDDHDDEDDAPAQLPASSPAWERRVVEGLRSRGCAPWVLEWVIIIRPMRLLTLLLFLLGCWLSSKVSLGPVFILISIIYVVFTNLGRRKEGEASAYSIFNPGVQRLPGQLDADEVDRQIRQGHI